MERSVGMIEKNLYRLICGFLLSCVFTFHFGTYLGVYDEDMVCAAVVLVISVLLSVFAFLVEKYKWITVFVALPVVAAAGTVIGWGTVYELLSGYAEWLYKGYVVDNQWVRAYSTIQLVWIAIFSYGLQVIMEKLFYVKLVFGVSLAGLLIYFLFSEYEASHVAVIFSLAFEVLLLIEWTELKWKKEKQRRGNAYMLWMMLFVGMFLLLMFWMPVSKEPYRWDFVRETVDYCEKKLRLLAYDIFQKEDVYDLSLSGFSREAKLGEGIVDDDKEIMLVATDRMMRTNLYLSGKSFNTFENMAWMAYQEEEYYDRYLDTLQTSYAIFKYDSEELNLYSLNVSMAVVYQDLNMAYLFTPGKLSSINNGNRQPIPYTIEDGSIFNPKNLNYGSYYRVDFYQMNAADRVFVDFYKTPVEQDDALWDTVFSRYERQTGILFDSEQIEQYTERCYDNYLIETELSASVSTYLDEVTEGCIGDIEKLLAIEAELSSYTYTKTPGEIPDDVVDETDFLEYFLLDSQEGYCTYYATAFVLLARAEGIPARYVQGYCVPMYGTKQKVVLSSMAHAWPEVYIKDIGWVVFEPTPGYGESREFFGSPDGNAHNESGYYTNTDQADAVTETSETAEETSGQDYINVSQRIGKAVKLFLFILPGMIPALLFLTIIARILYEKKTINEKYRLKVKRNIKLLGFLGVKLAETETLAEYRQRLNEKFETGIRSDFIEDYEDVIYGGKDINALVINRTDIQYKEILLYLKKISYRKYLNYRILKILKCDVT